MLPKFTTISKLYVANFLTGLVFWYGIEKLFMKSIHIDATGIGILSAFLLAVTLLLDLPSGMIADRWSRKGLLALSILFLAASGATAVTAHGLGQYLIAYMFYGFYLVGTSGTYQAITYDVLHEEDRAGAYSKIMGRMYALFLAGAGIANIASGFLANIDLHLPYWLTLLPCAINIVLLLSVKEPTFHKKAQKGNFVRQVGKSARAIFGIALLRSLTLIWCVLGVSELFKQDFSQLYLLGFTKSTVVLGLLWAAYAFAWAAGTFIAHRFRSSLDALLMASFGLLIALGLTRSPWGIALFMAQAVVSAAAFNLMETRVQDATPSAVRASILSVVSTFGRVIWLPSSLLFGWMITRYDAFAVWRLIALVSTIGLAYWLIVGRGRLEKLHKAEEPLAGREPEML